MFILESKKMKFKPLNKKSKDLAKKEHWKVQSVIVLEDGTKLLSSNSKEFEKKTICTMPQPATRCVINPGWSPEHSDMQKWTWVELDNDEINRIQDYSARYSKW